MMMIITLLPLLLLLSLPAGTSSSHIHGPVDLAVTIYNNQFAMVKDTRSISFSHGRTDLFFTDVSANIQPETVTFKALKETEGIKVFEQNFEKNLVNKDDILKKYIDKQVVVMAKMGTESKRVDGTLLGYNSGYILKTDYGIEVVNNIDGITFSSLPEGFFTLPTLNWKVFSPRKMTTDCEVAYRTTGFSWKADYTVIVDEEEKHGDVGGWVTIDNYSGKKYDNAKLKLIAGDVNVVKPAVRDSLPLYAQAKVYGGAMGNSSPSFSEKSFSDFHLYTLSDPVTLNDNSQKQVQFVPKVYGIALRKYNLISISAGGYEQKHLKASNRFELVNSKANKLGIPFPKGTVRVFKTDTSDSSLEFIGEDSVDHTPVDENITVTTGNAFDISADKLASNYRSFPNGGGYTAELNLTVTNHKEFEAEVVVEVSNFRGDNLSFKWITQGLNIEKVSSNLFKIKRVFKAGEKFSYLWNEDQRN